MANAVQGALATRVVWNGQEPLQNDNDLGVEVSTLGHIRAAMDRENIPPHVTNAVERFCAGLVEVREVWRATQSHDLIEKWDE